LLLPDVVDSVLLSRKKKFLPEIVNILCTTVNRK